MKYRVFLKKVFRKREEKMQEKLKMTKQNDEILVKVQEQCSVYERIVFRNGVTV